MASIMLRPLLLMPTTRPTTPTRPIWLPRTVLLPRFSTVGKELGSAVAYYQFEKNDSLKTAEATTVLYKTSETFGANKAPVYTNLAGTATYAMVSDTDWTDKDKDAVGKLSKIYYSKPTDAAKLLNAAGKDINLAADSGYYYVLTEKAASTTPNTNKSPKTFDAGIAMYVGMALTSVAGSAVVIGKKKEF